MSRYSLYILRCGDNSLYTGIAVDVDKRFAEHQEGKRGARYLRGRGPLKLVFSCEAGDRSSASRLEHRVKRLSKTDKEALVSGGVNIDSLILYRTGSLGQ